MGDKPPYRMLTIAGEKDNRQVTESGKALCQSRAVQAVSFDEETQVEGVDVRAPRAAPLAPPQKSAAMVRSGDRRGPVARLPSSPRVDLPCGTGTRRQTA